MAEPDLGLLYETVCEQYDRRRWPGGMPRTGAEVAECGRHALRVLRAIRTLYGPVARSAILDGQESYRCGLRAPAECVDLVVAVMRESDAAVPRG